MQVCLADDNESPLRLWYKFHDALKVIKMTQRRVSTSLFGVGLGAALLGLMNYGLGFWLTSHGNNVPAAGIAMIIGILGALVAGLFLVLSLIARIWEWRSSQMPREN
jgi:hypothetical protein